MNGEAVREVGEPDSTSTTQQQKEWDCRREKCRPIVRKRSYDRWEAGSRS